MRQLPIVLAAIVTSAITSVNGASAQGNQLVVMRGITASGLSGVVHDTNGSPVGGVAIVRFACPTGEFRGLVEPEALLMTKAEPSGSFNLDWPKEARVCLQFQALGFNTLQIEVRRSKDAGKLNPVLHVST